MTPTIGGVRAVVLAAGRGVRLHPLTERLPKPLLPIGNSVLVERTLEALAKAGVESAALNLHHEGEQIRDRLGDRFGTMPLVYSEERELLGTLGALTNLRRFLEPAELVVVVNGDSLCDWPVAQVLDAHRSGDALATLLVSGRADPADFAGGIGVEAGRVTGFRQPTSGEPRVFAGLQVFAPGLLSGIPVEPLDTVRDLYEPALAQGRRIDAVETAAPWFDLGTPRRYLEAVLATCAPGGGNVVSSTARVAADAHLTSCVVLPGARVGARGQLTRVIVGPEVEVVRDSVHESALLTRGWRQDEAVVTPLEPSTEA